MFDLTDLPPFEECSVILSELEYETFKHISTKSNNKKKHNWVYRKGRGENEFLVVKDDEIVYVPLPDGKYCADCRWVQFEPVPEGTPVWTQKDMMALGFK